MGKRQQIKSFLKQKALNWTAATVVGTDPLTDAEKEQLLSKETEEIMSLSDAFKYYFGFELNRVLVEFTPGRFIFDAEKFMRFAFDEETAIYKPDTVPNLVRDEYGQDACDCILEVRQTYR